MIKEELILPHLDVDLEYYDLGIPSPGTIRNIIGGAIFRAPSFSSALG